MYLSYRVLSLDRVSKELFRPRNNFAGFSEPNAF